MIYLIRHGQTQANRQKQYMGSHDSPLTQQGHEQHERAAGKLVEKRIDRIYTSPRQRCMALAQVLRAQHGVSVTVDKRIAEIDFGLFEGLTFAQAQAQYPDAWTKWEACNSMYALPDGESVNDFHKRVHAFARELAGMAASAHIAVVTHGGVIASLLCDLLELDSKSIWRFRAENGSVVQVNITDGFAYLVI